MYIYICDVCVGYEPCTTLHGMHIQGVFFEKNKRHDLTMDHGKQKFGVPFGEAPAKNSGNKVVLNSWTQRK